MMRTREDVMSASVEELKKIAGDKLQYFMTKSSFKVDGDVTVPMIFEELKTRGLPVTFSIGMAQPTDKKEIEKAPSKKEKKREMVYKTGQKTERISIRVTAETKAQFESFLKDKPTAYVYGDAALKSFLEAYEKKDLRIYLEA